MSGLFRDVDAEGIKIMAIWTYPEAVRIVTPRDRLSEFGEKIHNLNGRCGVH